MYAVAIIFKLFMLTLPVIVVGFVYSYILTRPGEILNGVYRYAENHLPEWLFNPLIGCEKCVSGQLSLWLFPFLLAPVLNLQYDFFLHIYFIAQSILNVSVLKYFYLKVETGTISEGYEKKELQNDPPEIKGMK